MGDSDYLYVLDTSTDSIYEIKLDLSDAMLDTEEILDKHGIDFNYCSFMYTSKRITEITPVNID